MSYIVCGPLGCTVIQGRYVPGKAVLDAEGQLVYTRDPSAVDIRRLRRVRKSRQSAPPEPAPANVLYLPHDDPRLQLGRQTLRPDGSIGWSR
jgi:hypothetical protein